MRIDVIPWCDAAAPAMLSSTGISLTITINGVATGPSAGVYLLIVCGNGQGNPNTNMKAGKNATILATYTHAVSTPSDILYPGCTLSTSLTEVIQ